MSADYEGALLQLTITGGTSPVRRRPSTVYNIDGQKSKYGKLSSHLLGAEVVSTKGVKSQRGGNKHDKIRNWEYIGFVLRKRGLRGVLLWGGIISSLKSSYRLKVGASIFLEEDETETTFLGRRRVRLGPILFTTHKIERRKGTTALNSEIKHWPSLS